MAEGLHYLIREWQQVAQNDEHDLPEEHHHPTGSSDAQQCQQFICQCMPWPHVNSMQNNRLTMNYACLPWRHRLFSCKRPCIWPRSLERTPPQKEQRTAGSLERNKHLKATDGSDAGRLAAQCRDFSHQISGERPALDWRRQSCGEGQGVRT